LERIKGNKGVISFLMKSIISFLKYGFSIQGNLKDNVFNLALFSDNNLSFEIKGNLTKGELEIVKILLGILYSEKDCK